MFDRVQTFQQSNSVPAAAGVFSELEYKYSYGEACGSLLHSPS